MNQPVVPGDATTGDLATELQDLILAVEGVTEIYPARPHWQTIAGTARAAVTGAPLPAVHADLVGAAAEVRTRIGIGGVRPAPDVARAVAAAVRAHLSPRMVTVRVQIAQVRTSGTQPGHDTA